VRKAACIAVLLGSLAVPASASTQKVALGDYESAPTIASGKTYSVGVFSVTKEGGKRQIVRGATYNGIYYPDARECDNFDLPLAAQSIPISSTGRFRIKEKTPVEDSFVSVNWKGHWSKPGVVAGSITIKHDGCTSKHKWTGGKIG
jgi:hypothetical protein